MSPTPTAGTDTLPGLHPNGCEPYGVKGVHTMFNRVAIVDAYIAYARTHEDKQLLERLRKGNAANISDLSLHFYRDTVWDVIRELDETSRDAYWALLARLDQESTIRADFARIDRVDGVTIHLETSDDDPFRITAHIHDPIASAWCDAHGALAGGTWEESDGPEFCYDILTWHPNLISELLAEGYDLDLSLCSDPDEEERAVMMHAWECDACQYDYSQAVDHLEQIERGECHLHADCHICEAHQMQGYCRPARNCAACQAQLNVGRECFKKNKKSDCSGCQV